MSIMKNIFIILILFKFVFVFCQKKDDLYLLFEKNINGMFFFNEALSTNDSFKIYTFNININGKFQEVYFDSETSEEKSIYNENEGEYRTQLHQKTISLEELKNYDIKDYKWLQAKINSFEPFQALYQFYDKIYIIECDSINQKAIITEVSNVEIID